MRNPFLKSIGFVFVVTLILSMSMMFWTGCSDKNDLATTNTTSQISSFEKLSVQDPAIQSVIGIQNRHTSILMTDQNIVGTATGLTVDGKPAILIFLKEGETSSKGVRTLSSVPVQLEGVPVITEVTGPFRAMGTTAVSHKSKQTPPISLGTSGGWRYDLANGYCCGGTLGALVQKNGVQYILSNYHVFWGDIVSGGNSRVATAGDPVIQPGLIDVSCAASSAQNVANLSGSGSLPSANVDVGYAQVISGMVSTTGYILEIGTISSTTIAASLNQAVKKSGRTTGLTRSTVSGLNGTISVQYENECAGSVAFTKTFTGQIIIKNNGSRFLNSGDSGSLMVQDVTTNPKAVGLLYAGSSSQAIANPIASVLAWIGSGTTMVGQ